MAWRGIHLSRSAYLSIEHRALKLEFRDDEGGAFRLSLEDLSYLILDTPEISISGRLLAELAEANVLVLGVNSRHLPVWTALPWTRFHRQGEVLRQQLEATLPQKKQLWSHIVRSKIQAQAWHLDQRFPQQGQILKAMLEHVRSGDPENVEARAARCYWQSLFPDREFRRHDDDLPNALLNYAYALLRACIARNLCALGFIPQLGLHHESLSNPYNLADDLIEPYRAIADHFALESLEEAPSSEPFSTEHRRSLARLLEAEVFIENEVYSMTAAIELTCGSLKKALAQRDPARLLFPSFEPSK